MKNNTPKMVAKLTPASKALEITMAYDPVETDRVLGIINETILKQAAAGLRNFSINLVHNERAVAILRDAGYKVEFRVGNYNIWW